MTPPFERTLNKLVSSIQRCALVFSDHSSPQNRLQTVTGQDAGASGDSAAAAASFHGGRGRDSPDQLGAAAEGGDDAQTLHRSDTPAALTSAGGGISTAFLLPLNI